MQLAEESEEYQLEEKKYSQDKLIKNILQDKKEVAELINQYINLRQKIKEK